IGDLAPQGTYLLPGRPVFLGYIPEGFKVYGGVVAREHSRFLSKIEREVHGQIVSLLNEVDPALAPGRLRDFKLGEVKNFASLVAASQREGVPLHEVHAGSPSQREEARQSLELLARKVDAKALRATQAT